MSQQRERSDNPGMEAAGGTRGEITFYLTIRPSTFGRSDVVLRLYRGERPASETVISTVRDDKARMMMLMSRMQLFRLGYDEHVPTICNAAAVTIEAL